MESGSVGIPYCVRHSQEATRNRNIIKAASLAGPVLGLLVLLAGTGALVLSWPISTLARKSVIEYLQTLVDHLESAVGLILLAGFIAASVPDIAMRALARFMPSLRHSREYMFLGLDIVPMKLIFANDEVAADVKRLNHHILSREPSLLFRRRARIGRPLRPAPGDRPRPAHPPLRSVLHQEFNPRLIFPMTRTGLGATKPASTSRSYGKRLLIIFGLALISFVTLIVGASLILTVYAMLRYGTTWTSDFLQDVLPFILMLAIVVFGGFGVFKLIAFLRRSA
jgi:hypothetical protein